MDAGRFHLVNVTLRIDTRNDELNPWAGWYVFADFERGAGWIDVPGPTSPDVRTRLPGPTRYYRGFFDVRRYNRISPSAQLNLRLAFGGWLSGDPLPLQRRLSIDGPGTVPGFDFRSTEGLDVGHVQRGRATAGTAGAVRARGAGASSNIGATCASRSRVDAERRAALRSGSTAHGCSSPTPAADGW